MGAIERSDFLTAQSSFLIGAGSCMNIGGDYYRYNVSRTPEEADAIAIGMDWRIVGNDLRAAMKRIAEESQSAEGVLQA